jgi:hypothetical protein
MSAVNTLRLRYVRRVRVGMHGNLVRARSKHSWITGKRGGRIRYWQLSRLSVSLSRLNCSIFNGIYVVQAFVHGLGAFTRTLFITSMRASHASPGQVFRISIPAPSTLGMPKCTRTGNDLRTNKRMLVCCLNKHATSCPIIQSYNIYMALAWSGVTRPSGPMTEDWCLCRGRRRRAWAWWRWARRAWWEEYLDKMRCVRMPFWRSASAFIVQKHCGLQTPNCELGWKET